ncbi:hypothetical protein BG004_001066 [Podila humilis]|nr:hypothetical protein BG004_001066 [Podila humilis]
MSETIGNGLECRSSSCDCGAGAVEVALTHRFEKVASEADDTAVPVPSEAGGQSEEEVPKQLWEYAAEDNHPILHAATTDIPAGIEKNNDDFDKSFQEFGINDQSRAKARAQKI